MRGAIPPLPQYAFMAWCLVNHRDSFTFTFSTFVIRVAWLRDCKVLSGGYIGKRYLPTFIILGILYPIFNAKLPIFFMSWFSGL
jgi:hypothetical protein